MMECWAISCPPFSQHFNLPGFHHPTVPISYEGLRDGGNGFCGAGDRSSTAWRCAFNSDRKSTRLNSSHRTISYAVFCLKKKKQDRSCVNERQGDKLDDDRTT